MRFLSVLFLVNAPLVSSLFSPYCNGVKNTIQLQQAIAAASTKWQTIITVCNDILLTPSNLPFIVSNKNIHLICKNLPPSAPCKLDAQGSGKGILWGNNTKLEVTNIEFKNSGTSANCTRFYDELVFNNIASDLGALTFNSSFLKIRDTTFTNNTAFMGGAINLLRSSLSFEGKTVFDSNSAGCQGGAINAAGENMIDVADGPIENGYYIEGCTNVIFKNNRAPDIGALSVWYYERFSLRNALFINNTAIGSSGAFGAGFFPRVTDFTLTDSQVVGNKASTNSGITVFGFGSFTEEAVLSNVIFKNNIQTTENELGRAFRSIDNNVTLIDCVFSNNRNSATNKYEDIVFTEYNYGGYFECLKKNIFCNGNNTLDINVTHTNCYKNRIIGSPGVGACAL